MTKLEVKSLLLCQKVCEVLNNNDWPTEEGQDKENMPNKIRILVGEILGELNAKIQ